MTEPIFGEITVATPYSDHPYLVGVSVAGLVIKGDPDGPPVCTFRIENYKIGFRMMPGIRCGECGAERAARSYGADVNELQCLACGHTGKA